MIAGSRHLARLQLHADLTLYDTRPGDDDEKVARCLEATAILNSRGLVRWPGSVLRRLPNLRLISCCSIGVDCVDLVAARELGITIANVPGRTATIVAEHALALLFGIARRLAWSTNELKQGRWSALPLTLLQGKRLGVVGTGNTGCEMIRLARAMGMEVVAWSFHPSPEKSARLGFHYVERDELLATCDAVSLHLKLTDASRGWLDSASLARMKPGALLVNTSRGAVVDEVALVGALESGRLGGAGLDVFAVEPLPPDSPLTRCEQVVLTPHVADLMPEALELLSEGGVDNILAFLSGKPQNVID